MKSRLKGSDDLGLDGKAEESAESFHVQTTTVRFAAIHHPFVSSKYSIQPSFRMSMEVPHEDSHRNQSHQI